jgi:hypothetical protein
MFNITDHSENGNQNHNEIPLYTHFNGPDGKEKKPGSVGKDAEELAS